MLVKFVYYDTWLGPLEGAHLDGQTFRKESIIENLDGPFDNNTPVQSIFLGTFDSG